MDTFSNVLWRCHATWVVIMAVVCIIGLLLSGCHRANPDADLAAKGAVAKPSQSPSAVTTDQIDDRMMHYLVGAGLVPDPHPGLEW